MPKAFLGLALWFVLRLPVHVGEPHLSVAVLDGGLSYQMADPTIWMAKSQIKHVSASIALDTSSPVSK